MNFFDLIIDTAVNYDVITFDVFDTLIIRDVIKPVDVFSQIGGEFFKLRRVFAEILSRKCTKEEDITLSEIYRFLPTDDLKKEIEEEYKVCRANLPIKAVFDELKRQGKHIYAISDMYLPKDVIQTILKKNGYEVDDIFVSSEYRKSKSTGTLFEVFLKTTGFESKNVLHIGDNKKSDVEGACKANIKGVLIPKRENLLLYSKIHKGNMKYKGFINNQLHEIDNRCERIGYEILGPILVGFCQWLNKSKSNYGFEKLFFMSRDMRLPFEVYCRLYGKQDCEYLYVSRKSLQSALDDSGNLCKYLEKIGFSGKIAVVDTGWRCVAQAILEHYAQKNNPETTVGGLYMGAKTGFKYIKRGGESDSCFYKTDIEMIKSQTYSSLIEEMLGQIEAKVVSYDDLGEPVFEEENKNIKNMACLQNGAMKFVCDWTCLKNNQEIDYKDAIKSYIKFADSPHSEDIELFGDSEYDDVKTTRIVNYDENGYGIKNVIKWLMDLRFSAWKGAYFIKSFGKLYAIPYLAYLILDSLMLAYIDRKTFKNKTIEQLKEFY